MQGSDGSSRPPPLRRPRREPRANLILKHFLTARSASASARCVLQLTTIALAHPTPERLATFGAARDRREHVRVTALADVLVDLVMRRDLAGARIRRGVETPESNVNVAREDP